MIKKTVQQIDAIESREALSGFLTDLYQDFRDNPGTWENNNLLAFLEALSAWVRDMDGYYLNRGLPVPKNPEWRTFAQMLLAASMYE